MATRAVRINNRKSLSDPRHLLRFLKKQTPNVTVEDIARDEGVSIATVQNSIRQVELHRRQNSQAEVDIAIRGFVRGVLPQAEATINGLLTATELVEVKDNKTGKTKVVSQEDKTTRLEASRLVKDLVVGLVPKGPAVVANMQQTTQVAAMGSSETNEERMRRLRKKAAEFNQLPPEVAGVPDSIDAGGSSDEEDGDEEDEE